MPGREQVQEPRPIDADDVVWEETTGSGELRVLGVFRVTPVGRVIRLRPSKAELRKRMNDKTLSRRERCLAYEFLLYRRTHGLR